MALTRTQVVDAAISLVDEYGLASLSMRQLAKMLDVQVGALYWHVKSKQDLLAAIADRILEPVEGVAGMSSAIRDPGETARTLAIEFRRALLRVRDGADIVLVAQALADRPLQVRERIADALEETVGNTHAAWGGAVLTQYVLGAVSEQQNQTEFARAGIVTAERDSSNVEAGFLFGVEAILRGVSSLSPTASVPAVQEARPRRSSNG